MEDTSKTMEIALKTLRKRSGHKSCGLSAVNIVLTPNPGEGWPGSLKGCFLHKLRIGVKKGLTSWWNLFELGQSGF